MVHNWLIIILRVTTDMIYKTKRFSCMNVGKYENKRSSSASSVNSKTVLINHTNINLLRISMLTMNILSMEFYTMSLSMR